MEKLTDKDNKIQRLAFTILLNPITKKNSQQIYINNATGKPFITQSKQYKQYEQDAGYFIPIPKRPIDYPVEVRCKFYRKTKHRVDLTNLLEAIDDVLVHYNVIYDDCADIIVSHDGSRVLYDKEKPRTEVEIIRL